MTCISQAEDRLHRRGQRAAVNVYYLVAFPLPMPPGTHTHAHTRARARKHTHTHTHTHTRLLPRRLSRPDAARHTHTHAHARARTHTYTHTHTSTTSPPFARVVANQQIIPVIISTRSSSIRFVQVFSISSAADIFELKFEQIPAGAGARARRAKGLAAPCTPPAQAIRAAAPAAAAAAGRTTRRAGRRRRPSTCCGDFRPPHTHPWRSIAHQWLKHASPGSPTRTVD